MTVQEFHINFDIELDKTLDFEYPYIQPEQKDYWLNKAQDRFVKSRAFGNNVFRTSFEETQKRIDDLELITKTSTPITPTKVGNNFFSTIPNDYLYLVRHQCNTNTTGCATPKLVGGTQSKNDSMNILNIDPFWVGTKEEPLFYLQTGSIVYETDGSFNIVSTLLTYIRKYNKIQYGTIYSSPIADLQCELASHTHQEILDIAISLVLENIESQRYQTNLNELTKIE